MSTHEQSAASRPDGQPYAADNYLTHGKGIMSWLGTLDHKRIGVMYLLGIVTFFLIGGLFALLVRTSLLVPQKNVDPEVSATSVSFPITHNMNTQFFPLHGAFRSFIGAFPAIPAPLAWP